MARVCCHAPVAERPAPPLGHQPRRRHRRRDRSGWCVTALLTSFPRGAPPRLGRARHHGLFVFSDTLDGTMARRPAARATWGAFLDSTLDRIGDAAIFGGLVLLSPATGTTRCTGGLALACLVLGSDRLLRQGARRGPGHRRRTSASPSAPTGWSSCSCAGLVGSGSPSCVLAVVLVAARRGEPRNGRPADRARCAARRSPRAAPARAAREAGHRRRDGSVPRSGGRTPGCPSAAAYGPLRRADVAWLSCAAAGVQRLRAQPRPRVRPNGVQRALRRRLVASAGCARTCATTARRSGCRTLTPDAGRGRGSARSATTRSRELVAAADGARASLGHLGNWDLAGAYAAVHIAPVDVRGGAAQAGGAVCLEFLAFREAPRDGRSSR